MSGVGRTWRCNATISSRLNLPYSRCIALPVSAKIWTDIRSCCDSIVCVNSLVWPCSHPPLDDPTVHKHRMSHVKRLSCKLRQSRRGVRKAQGSTEPNSNRPVNNCLANGHYSAMFSLSNGWRCNLSTEEYGCGIYCGSVQREAGQRTGRLVRVSPRTVGWLREDKLMGAVDDVQGRLTIHKSCHIVINGRLAYLLWIP